MKKTIKRAKVIVSNLLLSMSKKGRRHAMVGGIGKWKMKRDFQLKFLKDRGLETDDRLLDIGCGTLRGGIPVIEYLNNGRYFGIDVREQAIKEAELEILESKLERKEPKVKCVKDLKSKHLDYKFDCIWAFSVLIHMSDDVLNDCFAFVKAHLNEGGVFYANVNINLGEANQIGTWNEFPVMVHEYSFYEKLARSHGLEVHDLGTLKSLGHYSGAPLEDKQHMLKVFMDNAN